MEITAKIMIITEIRFPTNARQGLLFLICRDRLFLIVGTDYSNSFSLFSDTNYGHSFCNEQRFEDLKDFEPTDDKDYTNLLRADYRHLQRKFAKLVIIRSISVIRVISS